MKVIYFNFYLKVKNSFFKVEVEISDVYKK